jgi:hypothetical protein
MFRIQSIKLLAFNLFNVSLAMPISTAAESHRYQNVSVTELEVQ